jgi:hypothetical protein
LFGYYIRVIQIKIALLQIIGDEFAIKSQPVLKFNLFLQLDNGTYFKIGSKKKPSLRNSKKKTQNLTNSIKGSTNSIKGSNKLDKLRVIK